MVLGGLALAFSRIIDNSVIVLENIYRHLEHGELPAIAAEKGGHEVTLPVLAATLTTVVVFFPVVLLYGVSKFLFTALALAVVLSLFASYAVALTVVPVFAARYIKPQGVGNAVQRMFQTASTQCSISTSAWRASRCGRRKPSLCFRSLASPSALSSGRESGKPSFHEPTRGSS